jgi:hypothetical protein
VRRGLFALALARLGMQPAQMIMLAAVGVVELPTRRRSAGGYRRSGRLAQNARVGSCDLIFCLRSGSVIFRWGD